MMKNKDRAKAQQGVFEASIFCALVVLASFVEPAKAMNFRGDLQPVTHARETMSSTMGSEGNSTRCPVGAWTRNNYHTDDEVYAGGATSKGNCIDMVKNSCPGANIANMAMFGSDDFSCWCQYHNGTDANGQTLTQLVFQPGESYESCILSDVKYCHQEARACQLSTECTRWKGKCSDVFGKKTDSWCGNLCFAADKDDCCDINAGPVAGVAIGCILVVIFAIIGCCACCKCCCFKPKVVVVTQAPSA